MTDLDQSGHGFQRVRTYLGPSLGWTDELVQPTTEITVGGTYVVKPGDSLLLVDVAANVTIQLPDVVSWIQQSANQPATGFERSITIKDLGGNAANFNIVVAPFGQQALDNIQQAIVISQSRSAIKLVPLIDMSGWAVALASVSGGGSGGGDVFKAGNNTFTGLNNFTNMTSVVTVVDGDNSEHAASTAWVKNQNYLISASLSGYAPLLDPVFQGNPTAPTPDPGDNSESIATTEYVQDLVSGSYQPLNAGLSSLSGLTVIDKMYYLSGVGTWTQVQVAGSLSFSGGILASAAGGGNVNSVPTPAPGQFARWTSATQIEGVTLSGLGFAPIDSPAFSGTPTAPTPANANDSTAIATTEFVKNVAQPLDSDLTAISALLGTNTIYFRSGDALWSPVVFSGLTFSGGVLTVSAAGGDVFQANNNVFTGINAFPTIAGPTTWRQSVAAQGNGVAISPVATSLTPTIDAVGGDTNINLNYRVKGAATHNFWANSAVAAAIGAPVSATRYVAISGATASTNPKINASGGRLELLDAELTGDSRAVTPTPASDSSTKVATTAFVTAAIAAGGGGGATNTNFRALKTGSQTIPAGTWTKVAMTSQEYDNGDLYDTVLSRWTPSAGLVHFDGFLEIFGHTTSAVLYLSLYKNGASHKYTDEYVWNGTTTGIQISVDDIAMGADYYELWVYFGTSSFSTTNAWWSGHRAGAGPAGPQGAQGLDGGGFSTGDVKLTIKAVADTGWVMMGDSTIGSPSSNATGLASAATQPLFDLLFANVLDADCPILTSGGAATTRGAQGNAAAAWTNNCQMSLPKILGRALAGAGGGAGLTSRRMAQTVGTESFSQTTTQLAAHTHPSQGNYVLVETYAAATSSYGINTFNSTVQASGSGVASPIVQPTTFLNVMMKL